MKFKANVIVILISTLIKFCNSKQPSYQVSIVVQLHPQASAIHACNGVIVQSRLILTTASCVHYKFSSNNSALASISPRLISVISGSSTVLHEELKLQVADIFIADNFNYTTGANDLAILRLNGILPLDTRNDISWITLEDDEEYEERCVANFYVRSTSNASTNYIQSEQLPLLDFEACRAASVYSTHRKNDICSHYYLPMGFNCSEVKDYNGERGTGLVCGNKLVGLLSTILPWQNSSDCLGKPIKAYYAAVVPHISWIFDIITEEDLKMLKENEYISSPPYAGEANDVIKPQVTENQTALINTTLDHSQTTGFLPHPNNAIKVAKTNRQLLYGILAIMCYMFGYNFFNA